MIRTPWTGSNEEEARAYLQRRLTLLYKIMFWAYVLLVAGQAVMWEWTVMEAKEPDLQEGVYAAATSALLLMAVLWRAVLLRRRLSFSALHFFDYFYASGSGIVLGLCALFAYDYPPSHYVTLIYAYIAVFTRTIIVPSSGRESLIAGSLLFAPVAAAAIALGLTRDLMAPGHVFAIGAVMLSAVAVVLSSAGSDIIYGLRRQVTAAQQLGSYKLGRKIGEGGNGAVYLAHHLLLRRPTAIKLLLPDKIGAENLERFEHEVQHMSQLTHPNTVAVYDYGRSPDGVFYYAMEYLGGGIDLENLVRKHGPQPSGRVAHILAQVCGALGEAHDKQIIHRDIKPANIILCERGGMPDVAKVVDYGLVKEITSNGGPSQLILGTPSYVAPEAVTDPENVGPGADLYALGAVGYFLLTGKRVFEGKNAVETCIQHVTATPQPPSAVSALHVQPELEAILMKCLAKRPADRFESAAAMADAIRGLPSMKDWDVPDAHLWWRQFRAREQQDTVTGEASTITITVDLGERA